MEKVKYDPLELAFKRYTTTCKVPMNAQQLFSPQFENFYRNTEGGNVRTLLNDALHRGAVQIKGPIVIFPTKK